MPNAVTMARVVSRHKSGNQKVSDLPRLQVRVSRRCSATLAAILAIQNGPMGEIVEDAVPDTATAPSPRTRAI
jgi:hypothetical protein